MHSPAHIIATLLVNQGKAVWDDLHTDADKWKVVIAFVPDFPNRILTVYDTAGNELGRIRETGESIEKIGFQIMSRSISHPVGYNKLKDIWENAFKTLSRVRVDMPAMVVEDVPIAAQS